MKNVTTHTIITGQCLASTGWQNFSNVILYGNEAFIIDLCSYDLHLFFPSTTEQGIPVSCYFYRCCYIVLLVISCQLRSSQIVLYLYQKVCMFIRFFRCTHCFHEKMIRSFTKEVKIVPSEVTVKLLQQARQHSYNKRFIIDGFPRNEENRTAFDTIVGFEMISVRLSLLSAAASITS